MKLVTQSTKIERIVKTLYFLRLTGFLFILLGKGFFISAQIPEYKWNNLKIGGGGYVTGIVVHPSDKDIMYIRTDVGGAYRWNKHISGWEQMLNWVSPENANLIGVDGIALDPNNFNRVYLALGQSIDGEGGVFRSENRGETWMKLLDVPFEGNGRNARWIGECIAIDPLNSNIIYTGTRKNGLWRSTDDGKTWLKLEDVPEGYTGIRSTGIRSIVFNPVKDINGRSSVIYVGVPNDGIYFSNDGGESFSKLPGAPRTPARMLVVDRELFVSHGKGLAYFSNNKWYDITPEAGKNYAALAVDETDSRKIVVAQRYSRFLNPIYRSSDKGRKWDQINLKEVSVKLDMTIPWWPKTWFSSAPAGMAMVPGGTGELFFTDWFGVWHTPDVWANTTNWDTVAEGHEETVVLTLVSPSSGPLLYSGVADVSGFIHKNTTHYPNQKISNFNECFSISVCESDPAHIVLLGAKSWGGDETTLLISCDFGESWTERTLPAEEILGQIAISALNPKHLVYVAGSGNVYYSLNEGESWEKGENAPENVIKLENIWNRNKILASDLVNDSFYIIKEGIFYTSIDGISWELKGKIPIPRLNDRFINIVPCPNYPGEIWICLGTDGLWKTTDRGASFSQIDKFENARLICWGAPAQDSILPTAFVYGAIQGKWGMYRSVDMGKNWVKINDDNHQFPAGVTAIDGDKNVFGRIYVGSGGYGISYGEPANDLGEGDDRLYYIDPGTPEGLREIFRYKNDLTPFLSAHRGGPESHLPENHTVAFDNTLRHTYSIMEIDPRYTKDSVIIVLHDSDLRRTTTGTGKVSDFTYEELQKLELRNMKGNPTPYKIQTLKEVFEWAKGKTILVLDKKDVPIEERIKIVEECKAEAYAIVMAYSFEEAKLGYRLNKDIMMQVFIRTPEAVEEFDRTGVPWENVVVFVGHQAPENKSVFDLIHQKGALCIVGTSRNFDLEFLQGNVSDINELKSDYNSLIQMGVDFLETDIPVEICKVMFNDISIHPSKVKYFR